jgi:hypothetical protein
MACRNPSHDINSIVYAIAIIAFQIGRLLQIWLHKLHDICIVGC